jgi:hypothetical protein
MTEQTGGPTVEFGRIMLTSWEHDWATDANHARIPLREAKRVLPEALTADIYALLKREEERLLRHSLPFPPYDFRIRRADDQHEVDDEQINDALREASPLGVMYSEWTNYLKAASLEKDGVLLNKRSNHGSLIYVSGADTLFAYAYSLDWCPVGEAGSIDRVLGELSPRYRPPGMSLWDALSEAT